MAWFSISALEPELQYKKPSNTYYMLWSQQPGSSPDSKSYTMARDHWPNRDDSHNDVVRLGWQLKVFSSMNYGLVLDFGALEPGL